MRICQSGSHEIPSFLGQDLQDEVEGPAPLDRAMVFNMLSLSTLEKDVLAKVPDDAQFQVLLEKARLRLLPISKKL